MTRPAALVRAELLGWRGLRAPWLLLCVAQLVVVVGVSGLMVGGPDVSATATTVGALGHVGLESLFALVFGVLAAAGEYRHGTATETFLGTPRRERVLAAKLVVTTVLGALAACLAAAVAVITTAVWLSAKGGSLDLGAVQVRQTVVGGIGWNAAFAAIGVAIGALTRSVAGAVAAGLSWIALVEGLVGELIGDGARWLPFRAGSALGNLPSRAGTVVLGQPVAAAVLLGYVLVFALAALVGTVRRDVS